MSANIILTGLMGSGKTSVGKTLSKILKNYIFVDTDDVIVELEEMPVSDIFEKKSESYFRELEQKIIEEFSQEENLIISLGGGAFENETNRENLLASGKVFYLRASVDTLYERIKDDKTRPLLYCENPRGKLEELLKKREPNYLKANYVIDTDNKTINDLVNEISHKLNVD